MATQKYKVHVKTDSGYVDVDVLHAISADSATNATHATNADIATNATHASSADSATNATNATNATHAAGADSATNASYANNAGYANSAGSAGSASHLGSPRFKIFMTLADKCSYVITHNLNTTDPIIMFAGTVGNITIQWNTYGPNQIQVMNSNDGSNSWYGAISIW